jgi:SAM-dependent methyltransferase
MSLYRTLLELGRRLPRALVRRSAPVLVGDLGRITPVAPGFGYQRGTPIDRYYIDEFLRSKQALIRGHVLEVGEPRYTRAYAQNVVASDVLHAQPGNAAATVVGDLTDAATLPRHRYDCFICTQTFPFIFEVGKAIENAHGLLRPGGTLLATFSGISQISRYDMDRWGDFWRFTEASVRRLLAPVFADQFELLIYGNVAAAVAFLQGVVVEDLPDDSILRRHDRDYQLILAVAATRRAG